MAKHQKADWSKRVVEQGNRLALKERAQVNEYIAATHQVQVRKRRIHQHVLTGENAHVSNQFVHLVTSIHLCKKPAQPLRRNILEYVLRVDAGPCLFNARFADISRKNLHLAMD